MADIATEDRWWIIRPDNIDRIDVYLVRYTLRIDDETGAVTYRHGSHMDRDGRWQEHEEGAEIDPCMSIPGILWHYLGHGGNQDRYVQDIADRLQRSLNRQEPSHENGAVGKDKG